MDAGPEWGRLQENSTQTLHPMKTPFLLLLTAFTTFRTADLAFAGAGEPRDSETRISKNTTPRRPKTDEPKFALKVTGKDGWIQSPYDGKILDAGGLPSGALVRDPVSGKIMRVP
jgi:hypothetical protein